MLNKQSYVFLQKVRSLKLCFSRRRKRKLKYSIYIHMSHLNLILYKVVALYNQNIFIWAFSWHLRWKTSCYYQKQITGIVRIAISQFENGGLLRTSQLKVLEVNIEQQILHTTLSSLVRQFLRNQIFNKTITSLLLQIMNILLMENSKRIF